MRSNDIVAQVKDLKYIYCYLLCRAEHLCGTVPTNIEVADAVWRVENAYYDYWATCAPQYDAICKAATDIEGENINRAWHVVSGMLMTLRLLEDKMEQAAQDGNIVTLCETIKAIIDYAANMPDSMKLWATEIFND